MTWDALVLTCSAVVVAGCAPKQARPVSAASEIQLLQTQATGKWPMQWLTVMGGTTFMVFADTASMVIHDGETIVWLAWEKSGTGRAPDGRTFQYDTELMRWGVDCRAKRIRVLCAVRLPRLPGDGHVSA